ncbi:MAG: hypothetical protein HC923_05735 [Myxococcales bacterium]|nr:hypothetical protein [Myxococcales bacterium]
MLAAKSAGCATRGKIVVCHGAFDVDDVPQVYAVANTRGLLAYHASTRATFEVEFRGASGGHAMAESSSHSASAVDAAALVERVCAAAQLSAPSVALSSGVYEAVLDATAAGQLIRYIGLTCGARLTEAGGSFLSDRLGQLVADERVTIVDDFEDLEHRGAPFDVEGVARKKVPIIENGVARSAVYALATALRLEHPPTGHRQWSDGFRQFEGASFLVMAGEDHGLTDLIATVDRGVYIQAFDQLSMIDSQRLHLTGMVRGATRVIERGRLASIAPPMRVDLRVLDVLSSIRKLGRPRWAAGSVVPPMVVRALPLHPG